MNVSSKEGIAVLFSGGLDCTVLAALAHQCLPIEEPIDLLNVAFENPRNKNSSRSIYDVPDRLTGLKSLAALQNKFPLRKWNFIQVNVTTKEYFETKEKIIELIKPQETVMDLSIAIALWFAARGQGELFYSTSKFILKNYIKESIIMIKT